VKSYFTQIYYTVADLERAEPAPLPLGDGLTPSLTLVLTNAKFRSFYSKTLHTKY